MRLKDVSILNPVYQGDALDTEVSFVPMESLRYGKIYFQEIPFSEGKGKYTFFANGDLLIAKVTPCFENGNIAIANDMKEGIGFGSSEIFVLRMGKSVLNTYMFYFVQTSKFQDAACATMCGVGGLKRISPLFMRTYELSVPSVSVQQRIVDYLDEKTSAIDTRIELLEKKKDAYTRLKKATINQAVTRGLNENVKLKDSGVEWIGMIPEHWKIYRFKDVYNKSNVGESIDKEYCTDNEADYLFYTAGVIPIHTDFEEFPQWKYTNRNDLLLARNGTPYVYLPICNSVYSDHIIRVDIKKGFCREYVRFCLQQAISTEVIDSVSIPTWSISVWNKQLMSFPPFPEQQAIAAYLDEKCAKIDAAIANIDKQTDALRRLKRSLINEVITGQRAV